MLRLVLIVGFVAAAAAYRGPHCRYGPAFIDECDNDCTCAGAQYGCTFKACAPYQTSGKPKTCSDAHDLPTRGKNTRVFCLDGIVKFQRKSDSCIPGAVFKDDDGCNTCTCGPYGQAGCTFMLCPQTGSRCRYGPAFIDECDNDCRCGGTEYGCTRKACTPYQTPEKPKTCSDAHDLPKRDENTRVFCLDGIVKFQRKTDRCLPGAVFKDDDGCNTCTCGPNGQAGCTQMLCPLTERPKPGCPYGPGFIDECGNDCNCVDGRFYGCTRKACQPGEHSQVPMKCSIYDTLPSRIGHHVFCDEGIVKVHKKEPGCEYGPGFIDECENDCHCVDGRFYGCTRKACRYGQQSQVPLKCSGPDNLPSRPGVHVFCDEGIVKLSKPVCPYGAEFIDECGNDCQCLEHGYACSRKACKPGQTSMKPQACSGADNLPSLPGKRVVCHEGIVKVQDEGAECLPGSVYKEDCNQCSCSEYGGSACTVMACVGQENEYTVTCDGGRPRCPQDCGQVYNPARDCYDCPCGTGNPGDITVGLNEPCPPGTQVTGRGAFFKTCGPLEVCVYGLKFIDECDNDCSCMAGGYACTRKACLYGQSSQRPKKCTGSANLPKREGMRVFCHEGIVKLQDEHASCLPGSTFKDDCNSCFCTAGGQAGCTFKACPHTEPKCKYGPAYIDECDNDCTCDARGGLYGCTRKACRPWQTAEKPKTCDGTTDLPERFQRRVVCHEGIIKIQRNDEPCLPGSFYKDDCNTCTCGGGCTLMACPPRPYN